MDISCRVSNKNYYNYKKWPITSYFTSWRNLHVVGSWQHLAKCCQAFNKWLILPTIPAHCIRLALDQKTITLARTKIMPLHRYTSDRHIVLRKVMHFMSWQLFKPTEKCRKERKMQDSGEIPTHTYTPFLTHSGSRRWMTSCEVLYPSGQPTHCKFWPPQYTSAPEPWKEGEN